MMRRVAAFLILAVASPIYGQVTSGPVGPGSQVIPLPVAATSGGTGQSAAFVANAVPYASSTSALTTSANLTYDGTNLLKLTGATPVIRASANSSGVAAISLFSAGSSDGQITFQATPGFRFLHDGTEFFSMNGSSVFNIVGSLVVSTTVTLNGIGTDAASTDSSLCQITSTKRVVTGTGTLGICLGTSSVRYKEHVAPMTDGLEQIAALRPVNFFYRKGHGDSGAREQYGLLAEHVATILPKLVSYDKDGAPNSVDLLGMVPILIKAVQQQQAEIVALRATVAKLRRK